MTLTDNLGFTLLFLAPLVGAASTIVALYGIDTGSLFAFNLGMYMVPLSLLMLPAGFTLLSLD